MTFLLPLAALLLAGAPAMPPGHPGEPARVDVRSHGAVGDGRTDDSAAFLAALAEGRKRNAAVQVPPGTYRLIRTLTLRAQALVGEPSAAWNGDAQALPTLLADHASGPGLRLLADASVDGIGMRYRQADAARPRRFPPAIELAGVGPRVANTQIRGAWVAVAWDGKASIGRACLENLFIVDVHHVGVYLGGTWDAASVRNVEVWSPGSPAFAREGVGFRLAKNDALHMSDCFVFNAQVAYLLEEEKEGPNKGGTWASFTNCSADLSSAGLDVRGAHTLTVAGGTFWTHFGGLKVSGEGARVMVSGAELRANGAPAVDIAGGATVTLAGCQLSRLATEHSAPALRVRGGRRVAVSGCVLESLSGGIVVEKGVGRFACTGTIVESAGRALDDRSGGAARIFVDSLVEPAAPLAPRGAGT